MKEFLEIVKISHNKRCIEELDEFIIAINI